MNPVEKLMIEAVDAIEALLALLCNDAFHVAPALSSNPGGPGLIALIADVSPADEAALTTRGDDVALQHLAQAIGVHSGIAVVSFQLA